MKYWNDMRDKFGFGGGDSEPSDARLSREVYVRVVNALAERYGSMCRAETFDRPGMHNGCMVLFSMADPKQATLSDDVPPDAAMLRAIRVATDLELDGLVECRPMVDAKALSKLIVDIEDGEIDKRVADES